MKKNVGCSVFKRKPINKIWKGGKARNWKLGGDEAAWKNISWV